MEAANMASPITRLLKKADIPESQMESVRSTIKDNFIDAEMIQSGEAAQFIQQQFAPGIGIRLQRIHSATAKGPGSATPCPQSRLPVAVSAAACPLSRQPVTPFHELTLLNDSTTTPVIRQNNNVQAAGSVSRRLHGWGRKHKVCSTTVGEKIYCRICVQQDNAAD